MGWGWKPYVPVAKRRAQAKQRAEKMAKKGEALQPIALTGRKIASSFWGKAWCDNLESYSDYANRLPRGRTYVRNGSVIDLKIAAGEVTALVSGSDIYKVQIDITPLAAKDWGRVRLDCARSVDSLMDLLQGRFSNGVMERLTRKKEGLFPYPKEIQCRCSCPDWAVMCKHVAAVLYGVGSRLDVDPELLFVLRKVDHLELIREAVDVSNLDAALDSKADNALAGADLGAMFGIDLASDGATNGPSASTDIAKPARKRSRRIVTDPKPRATKPTQSMKSKSAAAVRTPTKGRRSVRSAKAAAPVDQAE